MKWTILSDLTTVDCLANLLKRTTMIKDKVGCSTVTKDVFALPSDCINE